MYRTLLISASLLFLPTITISQAVEPGAYVRISVNGYSTLRGEITTVSDDSIVVGRVAVSIDSISRIRVRHRARNVGTGAAIGAGVLGTLGAIVAGTGCASSSGELVDCSDAWPAVAVLGAFAGMIVGAPVGALFGALATSDSWEDVPLREFRVHPIASANGRLGLAASVRF